MARRGNRERAPLLVLDPSTNYRRMLTPTVSAGEMALVFRSMEACYGMVDCASPLNNERVGWMESYFQNLTIANGKHVSRCVAWKSSSGGTTTLNHTLGCYRAPPDKRRRMQSVWSLTVTYVLDDRYIVTDEVWDSECETYRDVSEYSWEPWYEDSPHGFSIESDELPLRDVQRDIDSLPAAFRSVQRNLRSLATWQARGLHVVIRCRCGHRSVETASAFMERCGRAPDVFSLIPRLRCSKCGNKGSATLVPAYHRTSALRAMPESASDEGGSLHDLYEALGGDGTQAVYMADGTYLTPDGENIDERDD